MKYVIFAIATILSATTLAQDRISFRKNDPFLFCHDGMDIPLPCWIPLPNYTGNYTLTGFCEPTPEGRPWTDEDVLGLKEYETTCPKAISSGEWMESGGRKDMVPYKH